MRALVDMLGWEPGEGKRAILQAGGRYADGPSGDLGIERAAIESAQRFRVVDALTLVPAFEAEAGAVMVVPGWKDRLYRVLDFSALDREGQYYVESLGSADSGGHREAVARSPWFAIRSGLRLERVGPDVLFYLKGQRCSGAWDRRDSMLPPPGGSGAAIDLHGGWFDASGDVSKYLSHLSYANFLNPQQTPFVVWALLESIDRITRQHGAERLPGLPSEPPAIEKRYTEEALHGADFLMRMRSDEGYFYLTVFDGWSWDPAERRICSYETQEGRLSDRVAAGYREGGGLAIAALARAASLDPEGEASDYTGRERYEAAVSSFEYLESRNASIILDGHENVIDDYCALLAAAELAAAAGARGLDASAYRAAAERRALSLAGRIRADGPAPGWLDSDGRGRPFYHAVEAGLPPLALLRWASVASSLGGSACDADAAREAAVAAAGRLLGFELSASGTCPNPFGLAREYVRPVGGESRLSFFMPQRNESGYWWQGENARLASLAAAAFRMADFAAAGGDGGGWAGPGAIELREFGRAQLHWILGRNPFDISMFQGVGRENPVYEDGEENAPGGVANGITSGFFDEADIDYMPPGVAEDGAQRWRWSEQWLPHAAWLLLAVCSE